MDSQSLFLTANADTIYYLAFVDLTKGPVVIEQPPMGLGTINDMWFQWTIDIGFAGPDRGEGGKYLLLPPGCAGTLPENGFFVARSRTTRALYASRSFLTNDDPKPTVDLIKKTFKPKTPPAKPKPRGRPKSKLTLGKLHVSIPRDTGSKLTSLGIDGARVLSDMAKEIMEHGALSRTA